MGHPNGGQWKAGLRGWELRKEGWARDLAVGSIMSHRSDESIWKSVMRRKRYGQARSLELTSKGQRKRLERRLRSGRKTRGEDNQKQKGVPDGGSGQQGQGTGIRWSLNSAVVFRAGVLGDSTSGQFPP